MDVSYDVACVWHKKLTDHLVLLPEHLCTPLKDVKIRVLIPKFHSLEA